MNGTHGQCLAPREPWIRLTLMTRTRTVGIVVTADKDTEILPAGVVFPGSTCCWQQPDDSEFHSQHTSVLRVLQTVRAS